jgi:hypothetical protein
MSLIKNALFQVERLIDGADLFGCQIFALHQIPPVSRNYTPFKLLIDKFQKISIMNFGGKQQNSSIAPRSLLNSSGKNIDHLRSAQSSADAST